MPFVVKWDFFFCFQKYNRCCLFSIHPATLTLKTKTFFPPLRVKTKTSAKYGLEAQPRLVDIIAAVPPQYRRALVPKLKAKPIRTASGVCKNLSTIEFRNSCDPWVYCNYKFSNVWSTEKQLIFAFAPINTLLNLALQSHCIASSVAFALCLDSRCGCDV